jgi:hypothetical protein
LACEDKPLEIERALKVAELLDVAIPKKMFGGLVRHNLKTNRLEPW